MLQGIEVCLKQQCLVSAVILIFSSVDALAALTRPTSQISTNRSTFLSWVERYLKPSESLGCSALDIYAARCGVLHLYSTESDLSARSEARQLFYQWRSGPPADVAVPVPPEALIISIEALYDTLRNAVHVFVMDSMTDIDVRERVTHHLKSILCYEPFPSLSVTVAA